MPRQAVKKKFTELILQMTDGSPGGFASLISDKKQQAKAQYQKRTADCQPI